MDASAGAVGGDAMRGWFLFLAGAVVAFTLLPMEIAILLLAVAAGVAALLPSRRQEAAAERMAAELRERMGYFPGESDLPSSGAGAAVGCSEAALEVIRKAEAGSAPVPVSVVGAEPAEEDSDGWTPLHRAAILGDYSQVVNLLGDGADLNAVDGEGYSIIDYAILQGGDAVVALMEAIAEAGLDPLLMIPFDSVMAEDYNTALETLAAEIRGYEMAAEIIFEAGVEAGLDPILAIPFDTVMAEDYTTALETLAEIWGYDMAAEIIFEAGRSNVNNTASRNSLDETIVWGPRDGATTEPEESDLEFIARLMLHFAAQVGRSEVISGLHSGGADPDATNAIGQTALHIAAEKGHAGAVRALLSTGAEPNARMRNGATPLHSAALSGQSEVITILQTGGAEPNVRRSDGATPLHLSAQYGHASAVHRLLDAGADPGARHKGKTPFDTYKGEKNDAYWRLNDLTER